MKCCTYGSREIAKKRRNTEEPLIIQSDRWSQFVSEMYQRLTEAMIRSCSKKGNPWDNACIEAFHFVIKREWLERTMILNYHHVYDLCFEYIEAFYHTVRIHSHCDYEFPKKYEEKWIYAKS